MKSAIVLLSSGLDSTVNLYATARDHYITNVITFDYGQRASRKEVEQSRKICQQLGLEHQVIELPWLKHVTSTALVNEHAPVPTGAHVKIDDLATSKQTAHAVWVPNRNGVFLNIAAAIAEGLHADLVVPGFNREEATTFSDNSKEYLAALDHSFSLSTERGVKTLCYTVDMDKTQIVRLGRELNVPFDLIWPCYFDREIMCGECESCLRFLRATK